MIIFLISSLFTAGLLDKKRMRTASVAYLVMCVFMVFVLLFLVDVDFIRGAMIQAFGKKTYFEVHFTLVDAIRAPQYGVFIAGAILLTLVLQIAVTVICTVRAIVYCCLKKNTLFQKSKNAKTGRVHILRSLYRTLKINLLLCRMLN